MKCSNCGTESGGNFCSSCGASLKSGDCVQCGAKLPAGARFCTRCGTEAGTAGAAPRNTARRTAPASGNPNLPWYLAGGVLLLLIIILVVPIITGTGARPSDQLMGPAVPMGAAGTPPPLTGTPREQADRLFDRIMTAAERGDTAEALRFTPMAIDAYGMAAPLDDDGRYHLALVHMIAGNNDAAIATSEQILADNANHLLGLAVAAEASERAGDMDAARTYYNRLLQAYDTEIGRGLPEYEAHMRSMPEFRANAQRVTGG